MALALGCSAKKKQHPGGTAYSATQDSDDISYETYAQRRFRQSFEQAFNRGDAFYDDQQGKAPLRANRPEVNRRLLRIARSAIGTPYVSGGMSPGGFDCSGLVCWTYKNIGITLPRTAREQSMVGRRVTNKADMQAGDIVTFRHPRRGYHTGIYVGDGKFIHSPRRRSTVRVASLDDPYFRDIFTGARRIRTDGAVDFVAQAESRLRDFAEEKAVRELSRKHGNSVRSDKTSKRQRHRNSLRRSTRDDRYVAVASNDRRSSRSDARSSSRHDRLKANKANRSSQRDKSSVREKRSSKHDKASARSERRSSRHADSASRAQRDKSGQKSQRNQRNDKSRKGGSDRQKKKR